MKGHSPENHPLIAIVGPTGAGKSALALRLSEEFGGEVVNCDSLQLYRGFDIGTAKVPVPERRGIPHHLIDVIDPRQGYSAGEYARAAPRDRRRYRLLPESSLEWSSPASRA